MRTSVIVAREFNVPYRRLLARVNGQTALQERPTQNNILTNDQECAVKAWIDNVDLMGIPPTNRMIISCANAILQDANPHVQPPPTVGTGWVYRFTKRIGYTRVKQKIIDPKRLEAEDLGVIQTWFDRLEIQLRINKITPSKLWNFDETGFQVGQGKNESIVTQFPRTSTRIASASSRESLTIIESVSAAGKVIPPLIILKGKHHMEEWYQNLFEDDYCVAYSEKGYSNAELTYEWLHHFDLSTQEYAKNGYRMLLMDNFKAHLTYEFIEHCRKQKIIIYCFPPHTTHFLQPLDDIPFQAYKHFHGIEVNKQMRAGAYDFDKYDFLYHLATVRNQTFTSRIIRAGFRDVGIHPYNPELVMDKLNAAEILDAVPILEIYDGEEQAIPSSPTTRSTSPPLDSYKIGRHIKKIEQDLELIKEGIKHISPNLERRVRRIMKGSLINAQISASHRRQVNHLLDVNRRKSKAKTRRQILNVGGVLTVRDANTKIEARKVLEIEKR
ncbi:transposon, putative [Talaromyces stipitatus ATCC 10500]|uniref:Transposon, putative n=1 Tax=Talaromyces stipitatus (strain ATCC 10500 / CBS 375.48 / QM 6759 / NRRL 1006) TaxID=441959 RepID=B8M4R4_TALSN|nr:transposon, putative [Talaromyces stipitatus ATCC 10500]EED19259.1 transposon, putative [Talaromyces stipitatus ATCC 10500]